MIAQAGFTVMAQAEVAAHGNLAVFNLHNNAAACAETAVALVLACAKSTVVADQDLRGGRWTTRYSAAPQLVLSGRTAVVLGRGEIGRRVTPVLEALGMSVAEIGRTNAADLDDALSGAAVLVMALPGTPSTAGIIDDHRLDLLAPGAIVVNVGRAGQIDEQALYHRLADGRLGGAGIDVWSIEPTIEETDKIVIPSTLPFHELDNVVMSPHKAGWLPHGDTSKFEDLAAVLNALNRGVEPPNRVDVDHGY